MEKLVEFCLREVLANRPKNSMHQIYQEAHTGQIHDATALSLACQKHLPSQKVAVLIVTSVVHCSI